MRNVVLGFALAIALAACATDGAGDRQPVAADYATALADPARPATERERDAARKPAELLAFAGVRPGMKVGDFVMGGGYMTRLLSAAVGPTGKVYAFQPAEFIAFRSQYGDDQRTVDAAYTNVDAVNGPFAAPPFPEPLDLIVTVQNFHDLYLNPFPQGTGTRASAALFAALKPGGTLVVVDHSAAAGLFWPHVYRGGCIDGRRICARWDKRPLRTARRSEDGECVRWIDPRTDRSVHAAVQEAGVRMFKAL